MGWLKFLSSFTRSQEQNRIPYERLATMLKVGRRMFEHVTAPLLSSDADAPTREEVLEMDREINRLEEEARRAILTAAAVNPEAYAATGMLTANLIRDAERIGDFSKNIFDVFENTGNLAESDHLDFIRQQRDFILRLFDEVPVVFEAGDEPGAQALIAAARPLNHRGSEILHGLLSGGSDAHPVAVALLLRFFRRIQSHLVHIVASIVMPAGVENGG